MRFVKNRPFYLFVTLFFLLTFDAFAQNDSRFGISIHNNYFPGFQLHEDRFTESSAYTLQFTFYDEDYTRLEYGFRYTRGFDSTVSYSAGFSVAYVIRLSDRLRLKPGLALEDYKMDNRTCRTSFRSILNNIFDVYEPCPDDTHVSFSPSMALEYRVSRPFSLFIQTNYRTTLSSTGYVQETSSETAPNGQETESTAWGTNRSFYGSGLGFGIGLRFHF